MLYGSINHSPAFPFIEFVDTFASLISIEKPDVSILPPFPTSLPPSAFKFPLTVVFELLLLISDQMTISPPSPISYADASRTTSSSIDVLVA